MDNIGLLHGTRFYKIRNSAIRFLARTGTEDVVEIALVVSGYEYKTNLIELPSRPVIVDLGGHIGSFSISMAKRLNDKCKIYSFEPDQENYNILLRNIALNKVHSIYPQNVAISDYNGRGYLNNKNLNNDAYYLDHSKKKEANCNVSLLPDALKNYKILGIDLLKIDIEGGEYKLFLHKQSFNYILKNVHYIFMEYHDIDSYYNYLLIKDLIEKNFRILNKRTNILTLENLHWEIN